MPEQSKTQLEKFKEAARELETDDDPKRFKERLGKLVRRSQTLRRHSDELVEEAKHPKHKPAPESGDE